MERFWEKVDVRGEDDCWEWMLSKNVKSGYGQIARGGTTQIAHRVAYELAVGEIPSGMIIMHTCDNRACCNPSHLRLGTDLDNQHDMYAKGRGRKSKGEEHHNAHFTEDQVLKIYSDPRSAQVIADQYGVTRMAIRHIKTGKNWKHVTNHLRPSVDSI